MKNKLLSDIIQIFDLLFDSTDTMCVFLMKGIANTFFSATLEIDRTIDVEGQLLADFLDEEF